jgi:hypothetical protein
MSASVSARAWDCRVDADAVLRGQGADPARVRRRSPRLVALAEQVAREGPALLAPRVAWRRLRVRSRRGECLVLDGGARLTGPLIAQRLVRAREVVAVVATIGDRLEARVRRMSDRDLPHALALEALGSAAVETLAVAVHRRLRDLAGEDGMRITIAFSPGMAGWPLEIGQRQIFGLLDPALAGVRLSEEGMMLPRKSLSMVFGLGRDVFEGGRSCDHCAALGTCRHRDFRGTPR